MALTPAQETARYIDALGPAALEKAANYTSGGHWLLLWGLILSALVTWIVVRSGVLDYVSARFEARSNALRIWIVSAVFFLINALLTLPWSIYEEWWREKSYGRTSQPLTDFLGQDAIGIGLSTVLGALFFIGVYAFIRRAGSQWWLWAGGFSAVVATLTVLASPILIEPLFNDYKSVPAGPVRDALLVMADEADIPHDRIFMYDGSRQSNNFTANVSGVFGSARIAISDVALGKATLDEVKAVTGHEIGHYVLGHIWRSVAMLALLSMAFFWLANQLFPIFARVFGSKAGIGDVAGLPVLMFIISFLALCAVPITNGLTRLGEAEADNYSLKTVNLPDALAGALVKTAEYRYPRPTRVQEVLFYSHPSVEWRVRNAMEWKAQNLAGR